MALANELLALRDAETGLLNPHQVVEWAREHPESRLHQALEWDDEAGAAQWRLWQVRRLIAVHVTDAEGSRRLISLSIDRREGGYRSLDDVQARPDLREIMLKDALAELERVQGRYAKVQELAEVWAAADRVREQRAPRRKRAA